jgi:hypothetical protein
MRKILGSIKIHEERIWINDDLIHIHKTLLYMELILI